jgi:hypothetical protein
MRIPLDIPIAKTKNLVPLDIQLVKTEKRKHAFQG